MIFRLKADLKSKKVEKGAGDDSQGIETDYSVKTKANQSKKKVNVEDDVSNASMAKDDDDDEDEEDDDEEEKDTDEEDADEDEAGDDDNDEDQSEDTDVSFPEMLSSCFHVVFMPPTLKNIVKR